MRILLFRQWKDRLVRHSDHRGTFYSLFGLTLYFPKQPSIVAHTWEIKPFKGEISRIVGVSETWSIWGPEIVINSEPVFSRTIHVNPTSNGPLKLLVYHYIKTTKRSRQFWEGEHQTMTEVNVVGRDIDERYCYKGALSNNKIRSNVVASMRAARELVRILNNEN